MPLLGWDKTRSLADRVATCAAAVLLLSLAAATLCSAACAQSNEWTWIGGSNTSGSVGPTTPGVYGTLGTPAAANIPGIRWGASNWTDSSGFFWLFGGHGVDTDGNFGFLNDLWKFNPSTSEWTWMSGSNTIVPPGQSEQNCVFFDCGQPGVYGTLGTPAVANVPGGRATAASWMDSSGNFWLFGGYGFGAAGTGPDGELNDLWMYNPTTNEWTWMAGNTSDGNNSARAIPGVYGTLGTPAAGNLPGGRDNASSSTDSNGNFWLFGGNGYDSVGACGILNDLWEFNPSSHEWTWMSGANTAPIDCTGQPGVYGTLGTPAAGNVPGGREGAASWIDENGNFWLFGGWGAFGNGYGDYLNDLWVFQSTVGTLPAVTPAFSPGTGIYAAGQTVQISDATPSATIYYTTDGSTPSTSSLVYSGPITISSTETLQAMATANHYATSAPAAATFTIATRTDTPTFSVPGGTYSTIQVVTISDLSTGSAIYYTTDGSAPSASSPVYTSAITVSSTATINAVAIAPSLAMSTVGTATYTILPNFSIAVSPTVVTVPPGGTGTTILTITPWGGMNSAISFACSGLPANATCSFSPTTVTPSPSAATTQLAIAVSAQAGVLRPSSWPSLPVTGLAVAACLLVWRPRRQLGGVLMILLLVGAGLLSGCGGGTAGGGGASPQSYPVTVTATSGTLQQTTTVTLTEN